MKRAIESMLPHGVTKVSRRSPLNERSSEHDVAGMTAKMNATLKNSGWMIEKTGIRNEVAILDSRGLALAGLRVDKVSEGRGEGRGERGEGRGERGEGRGERGEGRKTACPKTSPLE